jgi:hypothetical protein
VANVTMGDDEWVGLGASAGRIEFDAQATDEVNFQDCNVGIGTDQPSQALDLKGRLTISPTGTMPDNNYNGNLIVTKPAASGQYLNLVRASSWPWSIGTVYDSNTLAIEAGHQRRRSDRRWYDAATGPPADQPGTCAHHSRDRGSERHSGKPGWRIQLQGNLCDGCRRNRGRTRVC